MRGFFSPSQLKVVQPDATEPQCGKCGLWKTCQSPKMPPSGEGRRKILVVAEAPGKDEDKAGVQLVGNSGRELEDVFLRHGISMRRDCKLTNSLICRPPNNKIPNDKVIEYCRPNLIKTIKEYKPEIILLLGGSAVESLIGWTMKGSKIAQKLGIKRWAGYVIPDVKLNAWVAATYHPAYLLREKNPVLDKMFDRHLAAVAKLKGRPWKEPPDYPARVQLIKNPNEAARALRQFKKGAVAFDYETNMLKPDSRLAAIFSCAVSDGKTTIAYPWIGPVRDATSRLLRDPAVEKIGTNIKFEERWTWKEFGHGVTNWKVDTMLAAHALENAGKERHITAVKFQAYVKLGQRDWSSKIEMMLESKKKGGNQPNRIREIPIDDLLLYNGMDAVLEYEVAMKQWPYLYPGWKE